MASFAGYVAPRVHQKCVHHHIGTVLYVCLVFTSTISRHDLAGRPLQNGSEPASAHFPTLCRPVPKPCV